MTAASTGRGYIRIPNRSVSRNRVIGHGAGGADNQASTHRAGILPLWTGTALADQAVADHQTVCHAVSAGSVRGERVGGRIPNPANLYAFRPYVYGASRRSLRPS